VEESTTAFHIGLMTLLPLLALLLMLLMLPLRKNDRLIVVAGHNDRVFVIVVVLQRRPALGQVGKIW
jgi:type IV secretory pathway component VirB8